MHSLSKPTTTFEVIFHSCVGNQNTSQVKNLKHKFCLINTSAEEYDEKASKCELYKIIPLSEGQLEPVQHKELIALYSNKLLKKTPNPRCYYDKILVGAKKYLCCYCSIGEPDQLDHFLPKSMFPEFSILPINLLPICAKCNRLKSNDTPTSQTACLIHPYFEEYSNIQWLKANLEFINNYPTITFLINNELRKTNVSLANKFEFHFKTLQLNNRYSSSANGFITEIYDNLKDIFESKGSEQVRMHLLEQAELYTTQKGMNSWYSVFYSCVSKSNEFSEISWTI